MELIRRLEWPENKDYEALLENKIRNYAKRLAKKSRECGHDPEVLVYNSSVGYRYLLAKELKQKGTVEIPDFIHKLQRCKMKIYEKYPALSRVYTELAGVVDEDAVYSAAIIINNYAIRGGADLYRR